MLRIVTLLASGCIVHPSAVCAKTSDTATIALAVGGAIVGIMIIALIITVVVRKNPAWMPALPQGNLIPKANPWAPPDQRVRFGTDCAMQDSGVPLLCW
jgi:hypothetical protein